MAILILVLLIIIILVLYLIGKVPDKTAIALLYIGLLAFMLLQLAGSPTPNP